MDREQIAILKCNKVCNKLVEIKHNNFVMLDIDSNALNALVR